MKALMQRSDAPAIRDTILLYGTMILTAGIGIWLWPSLWSLPFWAVYGVLYGSASDSAAGTNAATAPPSRRRG
jgi:fatty acid desaturase